MRRSPGPRAIPCSRWWQSFHVVTRQTGPSVARRGGDEERFESVACHEAIAAAITRGERAEAEHSMAAHFDNTVKLLLASGIN